jgi:hypothetical protein
MEFETFGRQKSLVSLAKKNSFKVCLSHALHSCDLRNGRFLVFWCKPKLFAGKKSKLEKFNIFESAIDAFNSAHRHLDQSPFAAS